MSEKRYFFINIETMKEYNRVAYYRCVGIEDFVSTVEEKFKIVGIEIDGNNIGFIIDSKNEKEKE